jgi:hypothetical protein
MKNPSRGGEGLVAALSVATLQRTPNLSQLRASLELRASGEVVTEALPAPSAEALDASLVVETVPSENFATVLLLATLVAGELFVHIATPFLSLVVTHKTTLSSISDNNNLSPKILAKKRKTPAARGREG